MPAKQNTILDGNKIFDVSELFRCYFDLYSMFYFYVQSFYVLSFLCFCFSMFCCSIFVIDLGTIKNVKVYDALCIRLKEAPLSIKPAPPPPPPTSLLNTNMFQRLAFV